MEDLPDDQYIRVSKAFIRKGLYGTEPDLSPLENALINQMFVNVQAAKDRYGRSKENGAKGGRPRKWIDQEEAEALFKEHGNWKAVAEALDVDEDTLRKARTAWSKKAEKPKNLTDTVTDTVTVTDTDTDTVTSIYKNINSRSRRGASEAPSLPALKEGERWVTDPYKMADGRIAADFMLDTGEERTMIISEP